MQILILGGNGQLGRQLVQTFVDTGHAVTCLARGTRPVPEVARFIRADRDHLDGLSEAAESQWDVIVDLATQPGHVRKAVANLTARHWIYVSSVSVYQRGDVFEQDEDAPTHDPLTAETLSAMEDYGPAKVACEEAVRSGTESCTIIRAGLIAGDGDDTGRSGYYPWQFSHPTGADVLVPDDPDFPIAMIDVKDLAAWMVHCAELQTAGTFNATGPTISLREAIEASRHSAESQIPVRPVAGDVLADAEVSPWMGPDSLPWWIDIPAMRYTVTADTRRARQCGLTCRPIELTLKDALAYEESRGGPAGTGLSDATERRVRESGN
ncbi:NAD-dependent epimerase/dehydratase family protein [Cellulosimicrobium funkei]|nr:NAD-dependent epimerase/dehydratase family protein [Cellulosimicrobium funkei]